MPSESSKSVIIIGAGIAGLATGIYAQRNGYRSQIFELHSQPGGLMTGWKRKGYTIDGCIHWLTGSNPKSNFYKGWMELGILDPETEVINPEEFMRYISPDGQVVHFYRNIDRLEKHWIEIAPEDEKLIHDLCRAARKMIGFNPPVSGSGGFLQTILNGMKFIPSLLSKLPTIRKYAIMSVGQLSHKFINPLLRDFFQDLWMPKMSAAGLIFVMAYLNEADAGYPIGGSIPMAERSEHRYLELGGQIHYNCRVDTILVENNQAVGIRLTDGSEHKADYVISAADGHSTIFDLLDGKYVDDKIKKVYDTYPLFPSILLVGIGVNRTFPEIPALNGGLSLGLKKPINIGDREIHHLDLMIYNFDPTLAPAGKTVINSAIISDYQYWKDLSTEPERYKAEKDRIGIEVIKSLEEFFPGIESQVEMADVATPVTFERYTGNWQGSFEGFLPTPDNMLGSIPKTLPGLDHFYMAGQWVQAGGGLPAGLITGQDVVSRMCKADGKRSV